LDYDYDVIMLDEAQDASPVMWSVVKNQDACGKILVGDPNQEIYGFAGAKNAMDAAAAATPVEHLTRRTLSVSFRFGPEIASVACSLLALKGSADAVVGARRADVDEEAGGEVAADAAAADAAAVRVATAPISLIKTFIPPLTTHAPSDAPSDAPSAPAASLARPRKKKREQLVVLCRSNGSMFDVAGQVAEVVAEEDDNFHDVIFPDWKPSANPKIAFVGGEEALRLDQLVDVWRLAFGDLDDLHRVDDKYVRTFARRLVEDSGYPFHHPEWTRDVDKRLEGLARATAAQRDAEMSSKIAIVRRFGKRLPERVRAIRRATVPDRDDAHVVLSTAHKSKGLEFDTVLLWDDFVDVGAVRATTTTTTTTSTNVAAATRFTVPIHNAQGGNEFGFDFEEEEDVDPDEINLVYVAATRAKKRLYLVRSISRWSPYDRVRVVNAVT